MGAYTVRSQPVDLGVDASDIAVNNVHLGVGAEASRRGAGLNERLGRSKSRPELTRRSGQAV